MNEKTLKIGWMFPDSLYLHGDRGNVLALKRMGEAAGFEVEIEKIDFDTEDFTPMDYDFLFCSPGEIASFSSIIDYLEPYDSAASFRLAVPCLSLEPAWLSGAMTSGEMTAVSSGDWASLTWKPLKTRLSMAMIFISAVT